MCLCGNSYLIALGDNMRYPNCHALFRLWKTYHVGRTLLLASTLTQILFVQQSSRTEYSYQSEHVSFSYNYSVMMLFYKYLCNCWSRNTNHVKHDFTAHNCNMKTSRVDSYGSVDNSAKKHYQSQPSRLRETSWLGIYHHCGSPSVSSLPSLQGQSCISKSRGHQILEKNLRRLYWSASVTLVFSRTSRWQTQTSTTRLGCGISNSGRKKCWA